MQIDKQVPLPKSRSNNAVILRAMEVGDSVLLTKENYPNLSGIRVGMAVSARYLGIKVSVRKEGEGFRVWRVE